LPGYFCPGLIRLFDRGPRSFPGATRHSPWPSPIIWATRSLPGPFLGPFPGRIDFSWPNPLNRVRIGQFYVRMGQFCPAFRPAFCPAFCPPFCPALCPALLPGATRPSPRSFTGLLARPLARPLSPGLLPESFGPWKCMIFVSKLPKKSDDYCQAICYQLNNNLLSMPLIKDKRHL
jgi:hypothetical protein